MRIACGIHKVTMKKKADCTPVLCAFLLIAMAPSVKGQLAPAEALSPDPETVRAAYTRILAAIDTIPIYDNHSHPGFADDPDVDAMTAPPSMSISERLRGDNPELIVPAGACLATRITMPIQNI